MTAVGGSNCTRDSALVAVGVGARTDEALARALTEAPIHGVLAAAAGKRERAVVKVLVKPVLPPGSRRETPPRTYSDPSLVEALVTHIQSRGYTGARIAAPGPGTAATAAAVGYALPVLDLSEDHVDIFYGHTIGHHEVAKAWLAADVRVLVGKARTDSQLLYSGSLVGALGCVPRSQLLGRRLANAHNLALAAHEVLARLPVAFGVVDAGKRVLASADLVALDWVLGEVLGLDGPELNPVVAEALHRVDAVDLRRRGDLSEWGWSMPGAARATLADLGAGRPYGRMLGFKEVPWTAR